MTTVVNLRKEPYDVYIGRGKNGKVTNLGEYGCFGNPFPLIGNDRVGCIALYKEYFYKRIEDDTAFKSAILALRDKRLGCFCKQPNKKVPCHGDIIKEFLDTVE